MNAKYLIAALGLVLLGVGSWWWTTSEGESPDAPTSSSNSAPSQGAPPMHGPADPAAESDEDSDHSARPLVPPPPSGGVETRPVPSVPRSAPRSPPAPAPERVQLPPSVADRPFAFSDGSFLHLWRDQQVQAAEAGCWGPLEQEGLFPPLGVKFDLKIAADGSLLYYGPSIKQMQGAVVGGQRPLDVNTTRLYHCLVPFVRAIRYPPGPEQSGQVFVSRGKRPSAG